MSFTPQIISAAKYAFRHMKPEARAECVQEVLANALQAFVRLVQLKKVDLAYPTALARFGIKQCRDQRKVGGHLNIRDAMSLYCQRHKGVVVERLDKFNEHDDCWEQAVVQDTRSLPVDRCVAFRVDFKDWLDSLKRRDRRIAEYLSLGHRTSDAARKFKVSAGRISQLRRELANHWHRFVGEGPDGAAVAA